MLRRLRTATIALAGAILLSLVFYFVGSGPLWPSVPLLAILVGGAAGGLAAGRAFDVVALGLGGALGVMVNGVIWSLAPDAASDTIVHATLPATFAGGMLAIVAGATYAVGRRVPRGAPRLFAGVSLAVLIAGAWLLVMGQESVPTLDSYRIVDSRTIEVEAVSPPHGWTRVTSVTESSSDVRITVRCQTWLRGSGTAELVLVRLSVHLVQPLANRVVMDGEGRQVRLEGGP